MKKQELIDQLTSSASLEFAFMPISKVVSLLEQLDESPSSSGLTKEDIEELAQSIAERIGSEGTSLIDDYDLSISGREVELDSVEFDERRVASEVVGEIEAFFEDRGERDMD